MRLRFACIAAAVLLAFALFGCAMSEPNGDEVAKDGMPFRSFQELKLPEYNDNDEPYCNPAATDKPCFCMMCENKSSWSWSNFHFDTTLEGGNCSFVECNSTWYGDMVNNTKDNFNARTFAIGNGPGFFSTNLANLYCSDSLQIATKWMVGRNGNLPLLPQPSRAACWLKNSTLPFYIYYSEGKAVNAARMAEIARSFQEADVGPVMIATEADFNVSTDAEAVRDQIRAIKGNCKKCMAVLSVKSGDYAALEAILGTPAAHSAEYGMVDIVGFGFRANDYATCDIDQIIGSNFAFSRHLIKNYSKPSIWMYAGASEGNDSDGACQWNIERVHNFYQQVFGLTAALASSGTIGASFYEFIDGTGPLPCNGVQGCGFGVLYANGSQKQPEMNSWGDACKQFANDSHRDALIFPKNGMGGRCEWERTASWQRFKLDVINRPEAFDMSDAKGSKKSLIHCGEACPSGTAMSDTGSYDSTSAGFAKGDCEKYMLLEEFADDSDVSSTFMRAIIEQESNFTPYAVSCVDKTNQYCNQEEYTMQYICDTYYPNDQNCLRTKCSGTNEKPCAFGLAQCIDFPGQLYVKEGMPGLISSYIVNCGNENYNPFNPENSLCCGANKFRGFLDMAKTDIDNNWLSIKEGGDCTDGIRDKDREWAYYYLAATYYKRGKSGVSVPNFISQRDKGGMCDGEQNYIIYISTVDSYAKNVMSRYFAAVDACDSDCPGK